MPFIMETCISWIYIGMVVKVSVSLPGLHASFRMNRPRYSVHKYGHRKNPINSRRKHLSLPPILCWSTSVISEWHSKRKRSELITNSAKKHFHASLRKDTTVFRLWQSRNIPIMEVSGIMYPVSSPLLPVSELPTNWKHWLMLPMRWELLWLWTSFIHMP